jgi:hypothetical protein
MEHRLVARVMEPETLDNLGDHFRINVVQHLADVGDGASVRPPTVRHAR